MYPTMEYFYAYYLSSEATDYILWTQTICIEIYLSLFEYITWYIYTITPEIEKCPHEVNPFDSFTLVR